MPDATNDEEPQEPQPRDEPWDELREFVKAGMEAGITDASELKDIFNRTKNEDLRATANELIESFARQSEAAQGLREQLQKLIGGRELVATRQYQTELTILGRIEELSKQAQADDLHLLAETYVLVRHYSVAPGTYYPDVRHTDDLEK